MKWVPCFSSTNSRNYRQKWWRSFVSSWQSVRVSECTVDTSNLVKLFRIRAQVTCTDFVGRRTGFSCTLTHVGVLVDKEALRLVIFDRFGFPLFIIIPPMLRTHWPIIQRIDNRLVGYSVPEINSLIHEDKKNLEVSFLRNQKFI